MSDNGTLGTNEPVFKNRTIVFSVVTHHLFVIRLV